MASRSGTCVININVRHSPNPHAKNFKDYVTGLINNGTSTDTGLLTDIIDIDTNGMMGSYLEVELAVSGGIGATFVGTVYIESRTRNAVQLWFNRESWFKGGWHGLRQRNQPCGR